MAEEESKDLVRPNRDKASSKTTKAVVILILLVSVALMVIVTLGGWSKLQGAQPVLFGYIVVYLILAFFVARWSRGVLPLAAALAIVLGIFAAIAGPAWFERDKAGFGDPQFLWGGSGLAPSVLGLITLIIVPVQILQILFAAQGFRQEWQVEIEAPERDGGGRGGGAYAATA